jgi:hypothetical protein
MQSTFLNLVVAGLLCPMWAAAWQAAGQSSSPTSTPVESGPSASQLEAVHLIGLPDVKPNAKGSLKLTADSLLFSSGDVDSPIPVALLTSASVSEERVETGGPTGAVARSVAPYGSGDALGLLTQKKVGVLVVEFLDNKSAYHGAVFILQSAQAADLQKQIAGRIVSASPVGAPACASDSSVVPHSILVSPITVDDKLQMPAEYRVFLYEHLIESLHRMKSADTFYRAGDSSAGTGCTAYTLNLGVKAFKKGNEVLRASTEPVGAFVATTVLAYAVQLRDRSGAVIFEDTGKKKVMLSSDSVGVTEAVAKRISGRLEKSEKEKTELASKSTKD